MEKVVKVIRSFADAERSEKEYYRNLSPLKRLEILLELNKRWPTPNNVDASQRSPRVYRITKLE